MPLRDPACKRGLEPRAMFLALKDIKSLSLKELKGFSPLLELDVKALLKAEASVKGKKSYGSTNPALVRQQIAQWKKRLK